MKTNKTKPIKKLMIFTIITVMIVSLFAVPAFAGYDASTGQWAVDFELTIEQFTESVGEEFAIDEVAGKFAYAFTTGGLYHGALDSGMESGGPYELLESPVYMAYGLNGQGSTFGLCSSMVINVGSVGVTVVVDGQTEELLFDGVNTWLCYIFQDSLGVPQCFNTYGEDAFIDFASDNALAMVAYILPVAPSADGEEQGIFAVWSKITQWIVQGLASVSNAFYADGKLTLLGTLCIIPLALGLALLLISIVQKFLHLRG